MSAELLFRVAQVPKPFMGGDQAIDAFSPVGIWRNGAARQHRFENMQELFSDLVISLVASVVKRQENFIG